MSNCFKCRGEGKSISSEWHRQWDRYDQNSPSDYDTNLWMARSGIKEYETCPVCNGNKTLNEVTAPYDVNGKRVVIKQFYNDSLEDYILLYFENGTFAKVPTKDIKYFKQD